MDGMEAIVTPEEMAAIDAAAPEPVDELIQRAGGAVARAALEMLGGAYGRRVTILAGKGNNGADGIEAGRRLAERGVRCRVIDADAPVGKLPAADLVIDAGYGTGFRGSFTPPELPTPTTPVLAVDIPSGVLGLTGQAAGRPWSATRTITFAAWKPGLMLADGPGLAGEVVVADIGLDATVTSTSSKPQPLVVDYAVHHVRANGTTSPKVFKGWKFTLAPGATKVLSKRHSLKVVTTRKLYAGEHRVELLVNGQSCGDASFMLR